MDDHRTVTSGKHFYLEILKCNEKNKQVDECASPEQIKNYVETLTIKTFTYENMMNWNLRNGDIPLSK